MPKQKQTEIHLTPPQLDKIFTQYTHQADVFTALYRLLYPNFNQIEYLEGHPQAGAAVSEYIWQAFIKFDQTHHPEVLAGGLWMSRGWSTTTNAEVAPWSVLPAPAIYKGEN